MQHITKILNIVTVKWLLIDFLVFYSIKNILNILYKFAFKLVSVFKC